MLHRSSSKYQLVAVNSPTADATCQEQGHKKKQHLLNRPFDVIIVYTVLLTTTARFTAEDDVLLKV